MSQPRWDCKRKYKSRASRQARGKFERKLDEVRVTVFDSKETPVSAEESAPILVPLASSQIFNPREFEVKKLKNFEEFSPFFECLLDQAEDKLKKS